MSMRVTLIGAQGFVGAAFARWLRGRPGVVLAEVTRQNYSALRGTAGDLVIEAACNSRKYLADRDPLAGFEATVTHRLRTLLDFPAALHLHLSSVDVYSDLARPETTRENSPVDLSRTSTYGCHQWLAEELVRHHARHWLILRLGGMVGPGLKKNPVFDLLHAQPLHISPESQYQFLRTDDVVRLAWQLVEAGVQDEIFNLCGDGLVTPRQIARLAGCPIDVSALPPDLPPRIVDINLDKIKRLAEIPLTLEAIRLFLRENL